MCVSAFADKLKRFALHRKNLISNAEQQTAVTANDTASDGGIAVCRFRSIYILIIPARVSGNCVSARRRRCSSAAVAPPARFNRFP